MPQPANLAAPDWREIFLAGRTYGDWVRAAKNPDNARQIEQSRELVPITRETGKLLQSIAREVHIVAFAEDYVQDVVRFVPILQRLAETAERITIRYSAREAFPEIFLRFLTNGAESLPKFIFLNDEFTECGNWGPLPRDCRVIMARGRACNNVSRAREKVNARLLADAKHSTVIAELVEQILIASALEP